MKTSSRQYPIQQSVQRAGGFDTLQKEVEGTISLNIMVRGGAGFDPLSHST